MGLGQSVKSWVTCRWGCEQIPHHKRRSESGGKVDSGVDAYGWKRTVKYHVVLVELQHVLSSQINAGAYAD